MSKADRFVGGYDAFALGTFTAGLAAVFLVTVDAAANGSVRETARKIGVEFPAAVVCMLPAVALLAARGFATSVANMAFQLRYFSSTSPVDRSDLDSTAPVLSGETASDVAPAVSSAAPVVFTAFTAFAAPIAIGPTAPTAPTAFTAFAAPSP